MLSLYDNLLNCGVYRYEMLMKFLRSQFYVGTDMQQSDCCYLTVNRWDDFGFKLSFEVCVFDKNGLRYDLGQVRILKRGIKQGYVDLPDGVFDKLSDDYCSLGATHRYYASLAEMPRKVRAEYLKAMRDCVAHNDIYNQFNSEPGMQSSLLRSVTPHDVLSVFPKLLGGAKKSAGYRCFFEFISENGDTEQCKIFMYPDSLPPTNIHALIGRNGVGKTRVLAGIADTLTGKRATSIGIPVFCKFEAIDENTPASEFKNVIIVAYSVFDRFNPVGDGLGRSADSLPFNYIGIKKSSSIPSDSERSQVSIKSTTDLEEEFRESIGQIRENDLKYGQWKAAISFLSSDSGLKDYYDFAQGELDKLDKIDIDSNQINSLWDSFSKLSSGHKIVLLTITRIIEFIVDQTLILIDEPETHLHPPLLGSFIRSLSSLLKQNDSVALLATHSPVALQEVPESCVSILLRSNEEMKIISPGIETFAEAVGTLTRKVFALELEYSGYYKMLKDASENRSYDEVMELFSGQIGAEGRAITRALAKG